MYFKKMMLLGMFVVLMGVQCLGAALISIRSERPLFFAAKNGDTEKVQTLLAQKACVNAINNVEEMVLSVAAESGHYDTVSALLAARACVDATNVNGETALHRAAFWGHNKTVQILLDYGASVEAIDRDGRTALHKAVRSLELNIVRVFMDEHYNLLIKRCPIIENMGDGELKNGETVILPIELLEFIIAYFGPCDLANFRCVCKYFRVLTCRPLKLLRIQYKTKLMHLIESILQTIDERRKIERYEKSRQDKIICLLETELENIGYVDVNGSWPGVIMCTSQLRPSATYIDSDLDSDSQSV